MSSFFERVAGHILVRPLSHRVIPRDQRLQTIRFGLPHRFGPAGGAFAYLRFSGLDLSVLRRIRKQSRRKGHVHIGAALAAPVAGDCRQEHKHAIGLRGIGVLIDATAAEDHAAIGFNLFRQTRNIVGCNVGDPRRPFRRVTLFVQEIAPPLPALDPVLAIALIVQICAKICCERAKPSAMSAPGRMPCQRSALLAVALKRGSTTTILVPFLTRQLLTMPK